MTQTGARAPGLTKRLRQTPCAAVRKSFARQVPRHGRQPSEAMPVVTMPIVMMPVVMMQGAVTPDAVMPGAEMRMATMPGAVIRVTMVRGLVIQDAETGLETRTGRRIACRTRTHVLPAVASLTPATPERARRAVFAPNPPSMPCSSQRSMRQVS